MADRFDAPSGMHVGELRLRLPGSSAHDGAELGEAIARQLARALPRGTVGQVDRLELRVAAPRHGGREALVRAVTDAVSRALIDYSGRSSRHGRTGHGVVDQRAKRVAGAEGRSARSRPKAAPRRS